MLKESVENETQLDIYKRQVQEAEVSSARVSTNFEDLQRQQQAFELRIEEVLGQARAISCTCALRRMRELEATRL